MWACFPVCVCWPAAVSAIFKWLQAASGCPAHSGSSHGSEDLDLNFGKPPLLTVLKILCPIGAKPSPPPGIRPSAGSPFHRRPRARGLY